MKTNGELRKEARQALSAGWFWRIIAATATLYVIASFAFVIVTASIKGMEVQTWGDFLMAKAQNAINGLGYSVPSSAVSWQMTWATALNQFVSYIFGAIIMFGLARLTLKAVRNDTSNWFASSFGGFSRPLGVAWLLFRMNLQVFLWSLLFVVPGIVAAYRYRQAWYLKSENPDWRAGRCLAESGTMMRGFKWQAFCMDFYYIFCLMLAVMVLVLLSRLPSTLTAGAGGPSFVGIAAGLTSVACVLVGILVCIWISCALFAARAAFFRALMDERGQEPATARDDGNLV